ncbi:MULTISPECIES: N-acetyltransferase [Dehalobacter]|jgi:amino-acid N-acetyltransferase|uniref:N-acetyltransferase n=2 Tax=Dehalobacter restrictus TaxID=55583 RepID=A0A857DG76_9FIRM|nr:MULTISPECIES: N-acetyltransferase [Dehalobacter]AHF09690.1 acetyltransferase [Dehalobacter restrictus DSM 9455]MCG1025624.1 N-acetyltransferase [Dehalobacter sp.]MDJ0306536.1 N-acetyltransferase [Dehalobacter sp.]OCZ51565.1 GNAT family N-acetyltransferase [Dehalobacter sp. TeCB1]QHA00284.1 N-acetyltransferase [Dehalobacter restrictus]
MVTYRHAKLSDVEDIISLINYYAEQGLMLPRTRSALYEGIREVIVAVEDDRIVGTGALHITWDDLAEIRALAVEESYRGKGLGRKIVELLLEEAKELHCPKVFTLTYQVDFFKHMGFEITEKDSMPHKVWKECINCVKFPNCDENALILYLK